MDRRAEEAQAGRGAGPRPVGDMGGSDLRPLQGRRHAVKRLCEGPPTADAPCTRRANRLLRRLFAPETADCSDRPSSFETAPSRKPSAPRRRRRSAQPREAAPPVPGFHGGSRC
eukprot:scaffold1903_cov396-Prasinococcus_capsulatus_cf.AAC.33